MNETELIRLIKGNHEFARVPDEGIAELIRAGEIQDLAPATDIIREREPGQGIWVLIEGDLEVLVGGETVNRIGAAGEVVGQISAVSLTPATATVRTSSQSRCLLITHRALHAVMKKSPPLAESILRSMAKYL